ncbi:MAG: Rid family detoxifying hydrolase [Clostridiales bacterium]|uniref:Rid family detoxifying hydrolase n=1 Tax=Flavonifractor porci TaxID=3133422 RepID=UPI00309C1DF7|nr:Rid family detoxifying hydrolase [Clostridiales bacterium]
MNQVTSTHAPAAIGPYSQAIQTGNLVFVSGQLPIDPATSVLKIGDAADQTRRSMENIAAILEAAGTSMAKVVKTTILTTDLTDFSAINEVYGSFFQGIAPARACYQVAALPKGAKIEIEVVAEL